VTSRENEPPFQHSSLYWERRYAQGGDSGGGSLGHLGAYKAEIVNGIVEELGVRSVIELGCGDGNQLALARYPRYTGLDVSPTAVSRCRERFGTDPTKTFLLYDAATFDARRLPAHDMALSLDVLYHLVEDDVYEAYVRDLFALADRWVLLFSSNMDDYTAAAPHVRHRLVVSWIERNVPAWRRVRHLPRRYPDESSAEFFLYARA
jgi:SAM-dependent methyltransferase